MIHCVSFSFSFLTQAKGARSHERARTRRKHGISEIWTLNSQVRTDTPYHLGKKPIWMTYRVVQVKWTPFDMELSPIYSFLYFFLFKLWLQKRSSYFLSTYFLTIRHSWGKKKKKRKPVKPILAKASSQPIQGIGSIFYMYNIGTTLHLDLMIDLSSI